MVTTVSAILPLSSGSLDLNAWLDKVTAKYSPSAVEQIRRSCAFMQHSCEGLQTHFHTSVIDEALETANILLVLSSDHESICAALLRPVVIYTDITLADISEQFGKRITKLIDGVEKMHAIDTISSTSNRTNAIENLRNMLLTMVDDVRVVLIKLVIQCYIMRNLANVDVLEQRQIARQTLAIYAPLANRLGIYELKWELEDLAFRYLDPFTYKQLAKQINQRRVERDHYTQQLIKNLSALLTAAHIKHEIYGRAKHIYSIYKKMQRKHLAFDDIYDFVAARIIVEDIEDCYEALSIVHNQWEHLAKQFKDYIATPKPNGYRSIHTIVLIDDKPVEIQIRTHEMHQFNERGIAAHWAYKEGAPYKPGYDEKISWLRQILEWQQELVSAEEIPLELHHNIFNDRVFVFTPNGDTIALPLGSTPLDFAYSIHSDIGHRCRGAKVNGNIVPLTSTLKTGDKVEIITGKESNPSRDWLNPHEGYLHTPRARAKVHSWFKKIDYDLNIAAGQPTLDRELKRFNLKHFKLEILAERFHLQTANDLLAAIGAGDIRLTQLTSVLQSYHEAKAEPEEKIIAAIPAAVRKTEPPAGSSIIVAGVGDLLTRIAGCCKPLPGDPIIGYVTRGQGVSIHRKNCAVIAKQQEKQPQQMLQATWTAKADVAYTVDISIEALDNPDLLREISGITSIEKVNILDLKIQRNTKRMTTIVHLVLELNNIEQLSHLVKKFEELPNVYEVKRT